MLRIKSGRLKKPVKAVFYGLEGTGKSTLAAQTPNPLFFDTEGGTTYLDVNRVDQFPGWAAFTIYGQMLFRFSTLDGKKDTAQVGGDLQVLNVYCRNSF